MTEKRPGLDEVIASAADDGPSDAQLARLEARLGPLLAGPGGGPPASGDGGGGAAAGGAGAAAAAVKAAGGASAKWLLALAAAGAVGGGGVALYRSTADEAPARAPVVAAVTPHAGPAPDAGPAIEVATAPPDAAPSRPADAAPRAARPRAPLDPAEALAEEARLLERAQTALRDGKARRALTAAGRHRDRFPSGQLAEERERIAIEALLALGRRADAEARARRFRTAYPGSVQWTRIRELLDRPK